jgi:hypothetical protein
MRKALTTFFAFALLAGAAAGCSDSGQGGRLGEKPNREQPPAASPPTDIGGGAPTGSSPTTPSPTPQPSRPAPPPTR